MKRLEWIWLVFGILYDVQQTLENTERIGGNCKLEEPASPLIMWLLLNGCDAPWSIVKGCGLNEDISLPPSSSFELKLATGSVFVLPVVWHYVTMGLSSVCWVSLCRRKSTFLWKALPQRSHAKGLNPVCFLEWVMRFDDWLNALPQTVHLCGFSPATRRERSQSGRN